MSPAPLLLGLALAATPEEETGVDSHGPRALDGGTLRLLHDADLGAPWTPRAAWSLDVARGLVTLLTPDSREPLLLSAATQELAASLRLGETTRVGLSLARHQLVLAEDGRHEDVPGDLVIWAAIPLHAPPGPGEPAPKLPWHLAWSVEATVPTGSPELWLGEPQGAVAGVLSADLRAAGWTLSTELGLRLAAPTPIPGMSWGNRFQYGAGVGRTIRGTGWVAAELAGSVGLLGAGVPGDVPLEASFSGGAVVWRGIGLGAAAGGGLTNGVGSPAWRLGLQVDARARAQEDQDADGILDRRDACVAVPEDDDELQDADGCPEDDADADRRLDPVDACPLQAEVLNGWLDEDGCPDAVAELAVQVESADPAVPLERALVTVDDEEPTPVLAGAPLELVRAPGAVKVRAEAPGFERGLAELELGPGRATPVALRLEPLRHGRLCVRLVEAATKEPLAGWVRGLRGEGLGEGPALVPAAGLCVPVAAGAQAPVISAAGHAARSLAVEVPRDSTVELVAELGPAAVWLDGAHMQTRSQVWFALDRAELEEGALPTLDELAAWLRAHPEVRLLRVEGHADAAGGSAYNLELSRRRAQAVRDRLVALGVEPERLETLASGEARRPGEAGERMVGFLVLVWAEGAEPPAAPAAPAPAAPTAPAPPPTAGTAR